jgi:alcohol dehydrogenase (cytochrome c)
MRLRAALLSLCVLAIASLTTAAPYGRRAQILAAPAFDGKQLAALPTASWLTNGGDLYNRRYSPLKQITRENVGNLKALWRARLRGSGLDAKYSGEATPIVHDGVIYVVTGADDVFALSVDDGRILWSYEAHLDPANDTVCCGWTSRGVALGEGKVYVGQLDGKMVALDQGNGQVVWSVQAERWQEGFTITSAPLYYDGLVIIGFAGAEYGVRGRVKAFDARDGRLVWTFHTIPGPGEVGHDTWPPNSDAWTRGGGTVWQTPAVDPELGLLYFSTGNAGPDFAGYVRPGDNLFSSSIVAIEAKTGKYRWHFQQVHHDLWDYDMPSPVVLFDILYRGRMRKALAEPGKTGWVYILDRITGKPLIGIVERPVPQEPRQATAKTQPYPIGDAFVPQSIDIPIEGFDLINGGRIFTPYWTTPVVAKPGHGGGANWPPSAYDVATGFLYVCARDRLGVFTAAEDGNQIPAAGERYVGGAFGNIPWTVTGILAALDMRTNKLVWQQRWPEPCYSGSTVTAGGLLFIGRGDGRFTALNSATGKMLWQFQTGAGVNAPASVFEHRGEQYVVVYSGGSLFANAPRGDSIWLFSLNGQMGPVEPARSAATAPAPTPAANLTNGRQLFQSNCAVCHGATGEGGPGGGPSLARAANAGKPAALDRRRGPARPRQFTNFDPGRSKTTLPPTMVSSTDVREMSSTGIARMSRSRTIRSAHLPGSSVPSSFSLSVYSAPHSVALRTASSRLSASLGFHTRPEPVSRRVSMVCR